jgi:hypothetical protein
MPILPGVTEGTFEEEWLWETNKMSWTNAVLGWHGDGRLDAHSYAITRVQKIQNSYSQKRYQLERAHLMQKRGAEGLPRIMRNNSPAALGFFSGFERYLLCSFAAAGLQKALCHLLFVSRLLLLLLLCNSHTLRCAVCSLQLCSGRS